MIKLSELYTEVLQEFKAFSNRHIRILTLDFGGVDKDDTTICNMNIESKIDNKKYSFNISLNTKESLFNLTEKQYIYNDFIISNTDLDKIYIYDCIMLLEHIIAKYKKLGATNYSSLSEIDKFRLELFKLQLYKYDKDNL